MNRLLFVPCFVASCFTFALSHADESNDLISGAQTTAAENSEITPESLTAALTPDATFGDSLMLVFNRHPLLAAAQLDIDGSDINISATKVGYFPYFEVQSRFRSNNDDNGTADLSVIQPIAIGGAVGKQLDIARAEKDGSVGAYRQTQLELAINTSIAYYSILGAQDKVSAWENYYDRLNNLLSTIRRRVEQGRAAEVDIDSVNIRVTQAEAGLAIAKSELFELRSQLTTLTFSEVPSLAWPDANEIIKDYDAFCVTPDCVSDQHPSILSAEAEFSRQNGLTEQQQASRFPTLELGYTKPISFDDGGQEGRFTVDFTYRTDNDLQGYRRSKAVRQQLLSAEQRLESARRDVALTLISTRSRQQAQRVQFSAQKRSSVASQMQVNSFIRQYKAGKKTWLEVLNAEREVHQSMLTLIDIKANVWISNTRLYLEAMDWNQLLPDNVEVAYLVVE